MTCELYSPSPKVMEKLCPTIKKNKKINPQISFVHVETFGVFKSVTKHTRSIDNWQHCYVKLGMTHHI